MEVVAERLAAGARRRSVAAFPLLAENPYQRLLYAELDALGIQLADEPRFRVTWLVRHRRDVAALHVHWPNALYRERGDNRLAAAARLALFTARLGAARALGYRILWTVHQVVPHDAPGIGDRYAARVLARAAHVLLVHDAVTAERARRDLGNVGSKLRRVPHGSYTGVYAEGRDRATVRDALGIPREATVFLAFGHVRTYKALDVLLDAWARVGAADARLVVAGLPVDQDAAAHVEQRATTDGRIVPLLRFVPDDEVAELFGAADVVVLPRGDGGTSGALILALSLGRPVVAANTPSYAELTGDAGWLFTPNDASSLAAVLEGVVADDAAIARRAEAAREAAGELRWPEAARVTLAAIEGAP